MKKVLEVRHLTKRYGQHLALDNVNLTLEKGEVYGLIGRNGAGKTTLIKVILNSSALAKAVFPSSTPLPNQSGLTH